MGKKHSVRFQIGQLAEARTFVSGFRGAWFRCKVYLSISNLCSIYYDFYRFVLNVVFSPLI